MFTIYNLVHFVIRAYMLVIIIEVVLSYFMSPFHPIRQFLYRLVEPALTPIRRILPGMGGLDFSPLVLLILLQILDMLLGNILLRL